MTKALDAANTAYDKGMRIDLVLAAYDAAQEEAMARLYCALEGKASDLMAAHMAECHTLSNVEAFQKLRAVVGETFEGDAAAIAGELRHGTAPVAPRMMVGQCGHSGCHHMGLHTREVHCAGDGSPEACAPCRPATDAEIAAGKALPPLVWEKGARIRVTTTVCLRGCRGCEQGIGFETVLVVANDDGAPGAGWFGIDTLHGCFCSDCAVVIAPPQAKPARNAGAEEK